jgi:Protein of unknown function (DUF3301)
MDLTWGAVVFLCVGACVAWFWHNSLAARETANDAAVEACERLGLQFLDGTVAFTGIAMQRVAGGFRFRRSYVFDYTADSISRRQGFVVVNGQRVEGVGFAPEDSTRRPANPSPALTIQFPSIHEEPDKSPESQDESNVLDLEQWRRRRH